MFVIFYTTTSIIIVTIFQVNPAFFFDEDTDANTKLCMDLFAKEMSFKEYRCPALFVTLVIFVILVAKEKSFKENRYASITCHTYDSCKHICEQSASSSSYLKEMPP